MAELHNVLDCLRCPFQTLLNYSTSIQACYGIIMQGDDLQILDFEAAESQLHLMILQVRIEVIVAV